MSARQRAVLREMGLAPIWRLRTRASGEPQGDGGASDGAPRERSGAAVELAAAVESGAAGESAATESRVPADVNARSSAAGRAETRQLVPPGQPTSAAVAAPGQGAPGPVAATAQDAGASHQTTSAVGDDAARVARIARLDWDTLEADIRACTTCRLCEQREQAVPGVGDRQADWMLIGEAPGAEEDRRGEPFVGPAGRLLDAMLAAIGLKRGEGVFITNAVKCRPPLNRTPIADEIAACQPYLERQIALVRPRVLIALGRPAAQTLLGTDVRINAARGKAFEYRNIPVVVTYHPAYLLRNPADKGKAWEDLCFARRVAAERADHRNRPLPGP